MKKDKLSTFEVHGLLKEWEQLRCEMMPEFLGEVAHARRQYESSVETRKSLERLLEQSRKLETKYKHHWLVLLTELDEMERLCGGIHEKE